MKKTLLVILSSLLLSGCAIPPPPDQTQTPSNQTDDIKVPLPDGADTINLFWQLIDERRIPEAIDMMSPNLITDDSAKQAYGVQFNHIKSVTVIKLAPYNTDRWTADSQMYETTLEIYVSQDAADAPIPYYGFEDNPNIRFISLSKDKAGKWQIDQIGTGP